MTTNPPPLSLEPKYKCVRTFFARISAGGSNLRAEVNRARAEPGGGAFGGLCCYLPA